MIGYSDEYYLAMAALDRYPVVDPFPKSTSVVFRIQQLGQDRNALAAQLTAAMKDIDAYRGALGYGVPGDHDGLLSDGTTPKCGMCEAHNRLGKL